MRLSEKKNDDNNNDDKIKIKYQLWAPKSLPSASTKSTQKYFNVLLLSVW